MKFVALSIVLTLTAMPQTPDLKTMSGYPKMVQTQVASWIESAAGKMPEGEYDFRPDPGVRSFGQILGHIADANYLFCSSSLGESNPSPNIEKPKPRRSNWRQHCAMRFSTVIGLTQRSPTRMPMRRSKLLGRTATGLVFCG